MRTLLVSEIFPPKNGGSGRWFHEIYSRLPKERYLIAAGKDANQYEFDRNSNLQIFRLPLALNHWGLLSLQGLAGYWKAYRHLRDVVKRESIDMLHCGRCLPEGVMALALKITRGTRYLCYVHGEDVSMATLSREYSWLVGRVLRHAALVITNSENSKSILLNNWNLSDKCIEVLYPGVDTSVFVPAESDDSVRSELGWANRHVILTVGRLQQRKGHDHMILALRKILDHVPDVLYSIVGDGDERDDLRELTTRHNLTDHVQFLYEVGDDVLIRCYQQCDVFALPNRTIDGDIEGFGIVLLEAQACGKPVLAGTSGGTAETMRIPESGVTVDCTSHDTLANTIIDLLSNPERRTQMGQHGRKWVSSNFDWNELVKRAGAVFERLALASES